MIIKDQTTTQRKLSKFKDFLLAWFSVLYNPRVLSRQEQLPTSCSL